MSPKKVNVEDYRIPPTVALAFSERDVQDEQGCHKVA